MLRCARFLLAAAGLAATANGFMAPAKLAKGVSTASTELGPVGTSTGWDSFESVRGQKPPVGEESRKYRRTTYSHDDWKMHRSQDRFIYYLKDMFFAGVYKNMDREVGAVTLVASFVCAYNAVANGYTDLSGVEHAGILKDVLPKLTIPLNAFTLTSPSLGLLLGKSSNLSEEYLFRFCIPNFFAFVCYQFSVPTLLTNVGTKHERTGE